MADNKSNARNLKVDDGFKLGSFLKSWEMVLIYILIVINLVLIAARPDLYFKPGTLQSIIQSGMDVGPLVLGMALILMLGDIDVSCASVMIFASMCTGLSIDNGLPMGLAVLMGLLGGVFCGAINGFLVAYIGMPAVIVTISSSMLFRGIVEIILNVNSLKNFPEFYVSLSWNNIGGILPVSLVIFLIMGAVYVYILQKSRFGRNLYIIGNNAICGQYSGIDVKKTKLMVFMLMGFMSGVASIFFVGRMGGSVSSSMGTGYEMNAIATCVLGGISTNGGKGKMYGPIIATLIMAFLTYTLGLMDIDANVRKIVTGIVLITAILISNFRDKSDQKKKSLVRAKAAEAK
ncbi:MAG: ABC transporter permease [Lachnospiraceae bacterium]|nr:ABC transporter permease [Lachnospiraceae bacterium]